MHMRSFKVASRNMGATRNSIQDSAIPPRKLHRRIKNDLVSVFAIGRAGLDRICLCSSKTNDAYHVVSDFPNRRQLNSEYGAPRKNIRSDNAELSPYRTSVSCLPKFDRALFLPRYLNFNNEYLNKDLGVELKFLSRTP